MSKLEIYYDSMTEALWFSELNDSFSYDLNNYVLIDTRGKNPEYVENVISYDKPDIIVCLNKKPILIIEKTQEVPTGHNVGQRFARLVRGVECEVPTIFYFPFDAKKHGEYAGICNLNIRILKAAENIYKIHKTPLLCVNWPCDESGELFFDGKESIRMIELMNSFVESGYDPNCQLFLKQMDDMKNEYDRRLKIRKSYGDLPPSVKKESTSRYNSRLNNIITDQKFLSRPYTYVYLIEMTPDKCKRQDPYTGTAFIYDYLVCRNGPSVNEKCNNLVLYFPKITKSLWQKNNPNDLKTKSCNWYLTANILQFSDGIIQIR